MAFTMQAAGPILHWFTLFLLLIVFPLVGAIIFYSLGSLPGRIAASRGHPQAAAINICGWMGAITLVLWPIAIVWAYLPPRRGDAVSAVDSDELKSVLAGIRQASQRINAIEAQLQARSGMRGAQS
jgi:hypothetical protein